MRQNVRTTETESPETPPQPPRPNPAGDAEASPPPRVAPPPRPAFHAAHSRLAPDGYFGSGG